MAAKPQKADGKYDHARRRRATRSGRQRGCFVYIPRAELEAAGYSEKWPIFYRVWGSSPDGGVQVRLYREQ
jgi:hypothetical protein